MAVGTRTSTKIVPWEAVRDPGGGEVNHPPSRPSLIPNQVHYFPWVVNADGKKSCSKPSPSSIPSEDQMELVRESKEDGQQLQTCPCPWLGNCHDDPLGGKFWRSIPTIMSVIVDHLFAPTLLTSASVLLWTPFTMLVN